MTTKKTETREDDKLVTFIPSEDFTGWPNGYTPETRKGTAFIKGVESVPVPQSYLELLKSKGHVADKQSTSTDAGA